MKAARKDEELAKRIPGVLLHHQSMLRDRTRNELLYRAISESVTSRTTFLDVGSGTGIWAIAAAKLGAPRVVAIESEPALAALIHKHAAENNVAGRIEVLCGNSKDVPLKERFDVVVSEIFGSEAFGVKTVETLIDIRERFLKEGGVLLPAGLRMMAVPVRHPGLAEPFPTGVPVSTELFRSLNYNYGRALDVEERKTIEFLDEPKALLEIDTASVQAPPPLSGLSVEWDLKDASRANAIVVFSNSIFKKGIEMDGYLSPSWGATIFAFEPFTDSAGRIVFNYDPTADRTSWSISQKDGDRSTTRSHSPVFGFTRIKMAEMTSPHKNIRKRRK